MLLFIQNTFILPKQTRHLQAQFRSPVRWGAQHGVRAPRVPHVLKRARGVLAVQLEHDCGAPWVLVQIVGHIVLYIVNAQGAARLLLEGGATAFVHDDLLHIRD
jgi:hypothetical protein